MADKPAAKSGNLKMLFGGGDDAAPEGPSEDAGLGELADELGAEPDLEDEEEAMPPDFALHAAEAFPDLAGDDTRMDAFYRAIKACHPAI